jgi:hypothetical protein
MWYIWNDQIQPPAIPWKILIWFFRLSLAAWTCSWDVRIYFRNTQDSIKALPGEGVSITRFALRTWPWTYVKFAWASADRMRCALCVCNLDKLVALNNDCSGIEPYHVRKQRTSYDTSRKYDALDKGTSLSRVVSVTHEMTLLDSQWKRYHITFLWFCTGVKLGVSSWGKNTEQAV